MNKFTPRAQQVLALSRKEADRLNHNYVGTEHLLLGICTLNQGGAAQILQKSGVDVETVRIEVLKQIGSGAGSKMSGNVPYTPRFKVVLALAGKEAKMLNHDYVGTEHILLGLLREANGVAARILRTLGCDLEPARALAAEQSPSLPNGHVNPSPFANLNSPYARLEAELKHTREELFQKFEAVLEVINGVKADIGQLRHDLLGGNS